MSTKLSGVDNRSTTASSHLSNALILKLGTPLMVGVAFKGMYGDQLHTWRAVFALPFALCAAFFLSLAVVQVREGRIRYRRFVRWVAIDPADVVSSGTVWPPFIGYVRLSRGLPRWRRLYFVLDPNLHSNPFRPGEYAILNCFKGFRGSIPQRVTSSRPDHQRIPHRWSISAATGVSISLLWDLS